MKTRRRPRRAHATRIAVSLPPGLFRELELTRKDLGLGRSALVQQALRSFVDQRERAVLVTRYLESYRRAPEGAAEVKAAARAAANLLALEPWA